MAVTNKKFYMIRHKPSGTVMTAGRDTWFAEGNGDNSGEPRLFSSRRNAVLCVKANPAIKRNKADHEIIEVALLTRVPADAAIGDDEVMTAREKARRA